MRRIEDKIFLGIFIIILFGGFLKPIIKPIKINYYENRPANSLPSFSFSAILSKSFQDEFEKALSDQIPLASKMKITEKTISLGMKIIYAKTNNKKYNNVGAGIYYLKGNLLYSPRNLSTEMNYLEKKINNYNKVIKDIKDTSFYLYYIEKDTDINFENNEKLGAYEYIDSNLADKIKRSVFKINDFDDFKNYFYKTDHHWNYKGSYKAYTDIVKLLEINENPIEYKEEFCLNSKMSGTKAGQLGGTLLLKEEFCAYKYIIPTHKTFINNKIVSNYGNYINYYENRNLPISYGDYYGWDNGLIEFDYNNNKKENLLIIGESYDNAINELISTHFNKTYNVDLRAYKSDMNKEFNIKEFIQENKIDKVLLIGNIDYFTLETFMIS
jgi:hypothetical protein